LGALSTVSATIAARADRARVRRQRSNSVKQRVSYSRRFAVSIKGFYADREEIGLNATILAAAASGGAPDAFGARPDMKAHERFPLSSPTLETFPNPRPGREYQIAIRCPEFTSVCPKTGQPDFGEIRITYVPDAACIELKSLKFYVNAFRNRGIFYEAVTNEILDDLVAACRPRRMTVVGDFTARGGISTSVTASYERT
jgi:7-cyano-7-deazaguanine reductase